MKTFRSMNDWAFIGDEGVLVVWIQDAGRMIRMMVMEDSSPPQSPKQHTVRPSEVDQRAAAGGDSPTPLTDSQPMTGDKTELVDANFARSLERRLRVAVEALHYISKGYSGCEGHSGNHCAEHAREALRQIEGMK